MTLMQVLLLLTQAYPDSFCFASWQVRLATAHCTVVDSKGSTNRLGSSEDAIIVGSKGLNSTSVELEFFFMPT